MTDLQIWLLVSPGILLVICGGLAVYARYDARRMMPAQPGGLTPTSSDRQLHAGRIMAAPIAPIRRNYMDAAARLHSEIVLQDEQRRRTHAVRAGIASSRIEGGDVGLEAQAIMNEWAQGLIDNDTMTARIDALHAIP